MSHVFISFHNSDQEFVDELVDRLKTYTRLEPWAYSDRLHAGDQWKEEIDRAIEECRALVVVMTPAARASEYVTYEWAYAMGLGRPVVPILLKETEVHPKLGDIQHLDIKASDFWVRLFEDLRRATESQTRSAQTITLSRDVPPAVRRAVDELDSPDPDRRSKAIGGLEAMRHPAAYEVLIKALGHVSYDVRVEAARTLVRLLSEGIIEPALLEELGYTTPVVAGLVGVLGDNYPGAREAAAEVLVKIGEPAVPGLVEALGEDEWDVRGAAKEALVRIGEPAVAGLVGALSDENPDVREAVAEALGEIGDARAAPRLVATLGDDSKDVRVVAVLALGEIGDVRAVEGLVGALDDVDADVRREAARVLGEIGDASAVPGLLEALHDKDPGVRRATAQALGKIGGTAAAGGLMVALGDDDPSVRLTAKQALVEIGEPVGARLVEALRDENPRVRESVALALGEMRETTAVPGLVVALGDDDKDVRGAAAWAVGKIGDATAVPGLVAVLDDVDRLVREAAAQALKKIDTREAREAVAWWRASGGGGRQAREQGTGSE